MTAQELHEYLFITYRHSECHLNPTSCPFKFYCDVIFFRDLRNLSKYEVRIFKRRPERNQFNRFYLLITPVTQVTSVSVSRRLMGSEVLNAIMM